MADLTPDPKLPPDLRLRAHARLERPGGEATVHRSATAALGVLHDLAASPSTAADALALLHELQVHQVELELQAEELRRSRVELEAALARQTRLYDFAPVACCTIDHRTVVHEANRAAAELLGVEHDTLPGRTLESFLVPPSILELHGLLERIAAGLQGGACTLTVRPSGAAPLPVRLRAEADPDGVHVVVAFMATDGER
jgi:PAS domain S-box-containing protein